MHRWTRFGTQLATVASLVMVLLVACGTVLAPTVAQAASTTIVISQVYGGGGSGTSSGPTYKYDYVELHNVSTSAVTTTGWSIQYASASGSTWAVTSLNATIPVGGYYLVQMGTAGAGGADLPGYDATGSSSMSGTTGKVALCNSTTALTGTCPTGGAIVDFVGYGASANCYEGSAAAPAPSTTLADFRANEGCTDTDQNGTDFATATPSPRWSGSTAHSCVTTWTITSSAGTGGSISPSGTVSVVNGENQSFTITPAVCYAIADVTVDGVSQGVITGYAFTNVTGDHTIAASFSALGPYTITASAGTGGTVEPAGAQSVACGGSLAFTVAAATDYVITDVTVDGVSQGAITSYTFTDVAADHAIAATFDWRPVRNTDTGLSYATIQAAIDATETLAGHTITVGTGTFEEQVVVGKALTITGAGCGTTIIKSPATLTASFTTSEANKPIVFVNGVDATIQNLTIDGAGRGDANYRFQGLAFWNGGGKAANLCIEHVRDATFGGTQHGNAVYSYNNTGGPYAIELDHVVATDYQKTGFALNGTGLTVNVHDCTTTGNGYTSVTAQNGIQVGYGAAGTVTNCHVSDIGYTGTGWAASGVLTPDAAGPVALSATTFDNCTNPVYWLNCSGTIDGITVTNSARSDWQSAILAYNTNTSALAARTGGAAVSQAPRPASPFGEGGSNATTGTLATSYTLDVTNSCLTGTGASSTIGLWVYTAGGGLDVTAGNNTVTGWDYGLLGTTSPATMTAHENSITGNLSAGLYGSGSSAAERNWWGDASGPAGDGSGSGNAAYSASFTPWIHSATDLASGCTFDPPTYSLVASVSGTGGAISPAGTTTAYEGDDVAYTITPDEGYTVTGVLVDGSPVGAVTSYTFTNVTAGHTIAASFALAGGNVVAAVGSTVCITPAHPCLTVPVNITRTDATAIRLFHVEFTLSPELKLCGAAASSVLEGTYLSGFNSNTTFFVLDNGGGSYTADGTINGLPCGQTAASGNLFNLQVASNGGTGTGTVTINSVVLRDCVNNDITPITVGEPAVVAFDATPVTIATIADATVAELAALTITPGATFTACATGPATWSISPALPAGASFSTTTGEITWTPDCSQAGSYGPYTLTATAASGETDTEDFSITVTDVPGGVAVGVTPDPQTVVEQSLLTVTPTLDLTACAAGRTPVWSADSLPGGASLDTGTGVVTWTAACGQAGTYGPYTLTATVTAVGGQIYSGAVSFGIAVTHKAGTATVDPIADQTVEEQSALTVTPGVTLTDCAAGPVTWSILPALPAGANLDTGTGVVTWTPACGTAGGYGPYTLTAMAATGETGGEGFAITVTHKTGTVTVAAIPTPQTVVEQSMLTVTPSATATPCAGTLTWSVTTGTLPGGATLDTGTGQIVWTPGYGAAGTYGPFVLTATASTGEAGASNPFTIEVTHLPGTIEIAEIPTPQTVQEQSTLTITPSATVSPSVGTLTWSVTTGTLPSGATFSPATGQIVWPPDCGTVGTYGPFALTATASTGEHATSNDFTIEVTHKVGTVTVAAISTPQTVAEMATATITPAATVTDCASSTLTWSVTTGTLPGWASLAPGTGVLTLTPGCTAAGSYGPFALTATSATGEAGTGNEFMINVTDTPQAIGVPTTVSAEQVRTDNAPGDTTGITVYFTPPTGAVSYRIYRAPFGHYPEYDDDGGAVPTAPTAYPPSAPWVETGVTVQGGTDILPYRDFWYYVVYAVNACGDISAPSAMTTGTLDYHLGDVSDGYVHGLGNNLVGGEDISELGAHYGLALTHVGDLYNYLDVGPTTTHYVDGRPLTDDRINFEDLVMFSINYGTVTVAGSPAMPPQVAGITPAPAAVDALVLQLPDRVVAGETVSVQLRMQGTGTVQAASIRLSWDAAVVEPVGPQAGELLQQLNGIALSPEPGTVDLAVLGAGRGVSGDGVLVTYTFKAIANGDPQVAVESVDARDTRNDKITLNATRETQAPALPTVTALSFAQPNPFRDQVTLAFSLAESGPVSLRVYSVDGRLVRTLVSGTQEAGYYRPVWDGRDEHGNAMGAGMFYARLMAGSVRVTRPVVYLK